MVASGILPRSPVWLRKIPSTVSGSQGSRRGLRPAVRFAFPLGARLNITLRARPCQELFSESFSGRPAGRRAPRLPGFGPSRRRVRHYTRPWRGAGGKPARAQDADNSSAVKRRGSQAESGIGLALRPAPACMAAPQSRRFPPAHRRGRFSFLYKQRSAPAFGRRPFRAVVTQAALPPVAGFPLFASAKLLTVRTPAVPPNPAFGGDSLPKKNGRLRARPLPRAGNPLGDRPWSIPSIYL